MVFELPKVTFLDAAGLRLMLEIQRRALDAGGTVRLAAPSRSARKLLMLTGCARAFPTFDTLDDAVSVPLDHEPQPVA